MRMGYLKKVDVNLWSRCVIKTWHRIFKSKDNCDAIYDVVVATRRDVLATQLTASIKSANAANDLISESDPVQSTLIANFKRRSDDA